MTAVFDMHRVHLIAQRRSLMNHRRHHLVFEDPSDWRTWDQRKDFERYAHDDDLMEALRGARAFGEMPWGRA